jgi:acyl-CoA thioester hydrolase
VTHQHTIRMYYEDTDAGGVVYYANYLRFAERARTEYLRSLGFENSEIRDNYGILIVVKSVEAEYLSPARLDDVLVMRSRLVSVKNTSFVMEQKAYRDDVCIFNMTIVLVCVDDGQGKPARIPDNLKTAFQKDMV